MCCKGLDPGHFLSSLAARNAVPLLPGVVLLVLSEPGSCTGLLAGGHVSAF